MNQLLKIGLFVHPWKLVFLRPVTICHHPVMSAYDTGKKTKPKNALSVLMLHTFIIDQCDFLIQDRPEKITIKRLHFTRVRKEQVFFPRNEFVGSHFLDSKQIITIT